MSGSVKLNTPSAGSVTLSPADTASNLTATIPAATDTLVNLGSTQTLTNKTLTAAGSNTVEATSGPTSTQLAGMRNKIINGAMMIDQRNAGASVTPNGSYTLDRWLANNSQTGKYTVQQNAGSVTPPAGFVNYLGVTSTSAYSITSTDYFWVGQLVEGFNIADLAWGTAAAQSITISFWVRSSLTGTFAGGLRNANANRSYGFNYTISLANTWEQKTVTIAGDTTGTWATNNGVGIRLEFSLGVGSTYTQTAGSWSAGNYDVASGGQSIVGTNGATFYITGVQLEKGTVATPFENRLYGAELALCQRYYLLLPAINTCTWVGDSENATLSSIYLGQFPAPMRATPTAAISNMNIYLSSGGTSPSATLGANRCTTLTAAIQVNSSGLTTGQAVVFYSATNNGSLTFNAEL
jgi:hypothetical protein